MFFKHSFEAKARQKSRSQREMLGKFTALGSLAQPGGGPSCDCAREALHERLIYFEIQGRPAQLLGVAHKNTALAEQPKGGNRRLLLARFSGKKPFHQARNASQIRGSLLGHEAAEGRRRPHGLPIEDAQITAEFVTGREWTQLALDVTAQCRFRRWRLRG